MKFFDSFLETMMMKGKTTTVQIDFEMLVIDADFDFEEIDVKKAIYSCAHYYYYYYFSKMIPKMILNSVFELVGISSFFPPKRFCQHLVVVVLVSTRASPAAEVSEVMMNCWIFSPPEVSFLQCRFLKSNSPNLMKARSLAKPKLNSPQLLLPQIRFSPTQHTCRIQNEVRKTTTNNCPKRIVPLISFLRDDLFLPPIHDPPSDVRIPTR